MIPNATVSYLITVTTLSHLSEWSVFKKKTLQLKMTNRKSSVISTKRRWRPNKKLNQSKFHEERHFKYKTLTKVLKKRPLNHITPVKVISSVKNVVISASRTQRRR